jgi:hypothetical protein
MNLISKPQSELSRYGEYPPNRYRTQNRYYNYPGTLDHLIRFGQL